MCCPLQKKKIKKMGKTFETRNIDVVSLHCDGWSQRDCWLRLSIARASSALHSPCTSIALSFKGQAYFGKKIVLFRWISPFISGKSKTRRKATAPPKATGVKKRRVLIAVHEQTHTTQSASWQLPSIKGSSSQKAPPLSQGRCPKGAEG